LVKSGLRQVGFSASVLVIVSGTLVFLLGRDEAYSESAFIACGIAAGHFIRSLYLYFQNSLFVEDRARDIFRLNVFLLIFGILVVLGMTYAFGAVGASFSGGLVYLVMSFVGKRASSDVPWVKIPLQVVFLPASSIVVLLLMEFMKTIYDYDLYDVGFWALSALEVTVLFVFWRGLIKSTVQLVVGKIVRVR